MIDILRMCSSIMFTLYSWKLLLVIIDFRFVSHLLSIRMVYPAVFVFVYVATLMSRSHVAVGRPERECKVLLVPAVICSNPLDDNALHTCNIQHTTTFNMHTLAYEWSATFRARNSR